MNIATARLHFVSPCFRFVRSVVAHLSRIDTVCSLRCRSLVSRRFSRCAFASLRLPSLRSARKLLASMRLVRSVVAHLSRVDSVVVPSRRFGSTPFAPLGNYSRRCAPFIVIYEIAINRVGLRAEVEGVEPQHRGGETTVSTRDNVTEWKEWS